MKKRHTYRIFTSFVAAIPMTIILQAILRYGNQSDGRILVTTSCEGSCSRMTPVHAFQMECFGCC